MRNSTIRGKLSTIGLGLITTSRARLQVPQLNLRLKSIGPTIVINFLGIELDTKVMEICLLADKLA